MLLQQLALLAGYDLEDLGHNSAEYVHLVVEAAKLAFADRERYYGDPLFVDVPLGRLLSEDYAAGRRALDRPAGRFGSGGTGKRLGFRWEPVGERPRWAMVGGAG